LFKAVFASGSVMLREHFRSVAPIIEYSKKNFYNHELRPLRLPRASERLDPPLLDVYIEGGLRSGHTNEAEAQFIVAEISRIVQDPGMQGRTIGVVSLLGQEQALMIMELLGRELGSELISRYEIACGDARTFQGKEKDIIFLSMVVSEGQAKALSGAAYEQRFNVAASRARDRMYLVRSIQPEALSAADHLRLGLIRHVQNPLEAELVQQQALPQGKTRLAGALQAWLAAQGYRVLPRVPVGQYRIDLVVEGARDQRLAIACAGDEPFVAGQWEQELRYQRVLERAGWTFWRCFASDFILRQEAVLAELQGVLAAQGIQPHKGMQTGPGQYSEQRIIRLGTARADSAGRDEDIRY
jgi:very-short-patch-repair endonuclease